LRLREYSFCFVVVCNWLIMNNKINLILTNLNEDEKSNLKKSRKKKTRSSIAKRTLTQKFNVKSLQMHEKN